MKTIQIIVWGLGIALMLLIFSICWVACGLPYGSQTVTSSMNTVIIDRLLVPIVGVLALFGILIKELLPTKTKDDK